LKDVLIESQIVAEGSINGVIDGKQNNQCIRAHKYVYEAALVRLAWGEFMKGLENSDHKLLITVKLLLEKVSAMASDLKQEAFDGPLQSPLTITQVMTKFTLSEAKHQGIIIRMAWRCRYQLPSRYARKRPRTIDALHSIYICHTEC